jgi:chaperone modulatory protein CbpM
MITFDAVIRLVGDLEAGELRHWIEESWVRAEVVEEGYSFHEVDVARIRLIRELRHELAIDEEAMPVVLQLLDQVYALRRRLRAMQGAIDALPPEARALLRLGPDEE